MEKIISKEDLDKLKTIKGEVRGISLKRYGEYILKEKEEAGLKKVEEAMADIGCPLKYREIKQTNFYPLWYNVLTFLAIKKLFNFDDKKFQEMGRFCFKSPLLIKLLAKYLVSFDKAVKSVHNMWSVYFTVGRLSVTDYSQKERYVIVSLKDYPLYPTEFPRIHCQYLTGYFPSVLQMVVGVKATGKEIKCVYRGDEDHQFLLNW